MSKRSREEFEPNNNNNNNNEGYEAPERPTKRARISLQPLNNVMNTNANAKKSDNKKSREFQTHSNKLHENGIKTRQETIEQNRKLKRQFALQQKHENALGVRMSDPSAWFGFSTNTNRNYMNEGCNGRESSFDSVESAYSNSDQSMTSNTNSNTNNNYNPTTNTNHNDIHSAHSAYCTPGPFKGKRRQSSIPKTCPPNTTKPYANTTDTNLNNINDINVNRHLHRPRKNVFPYFATNPFADNVLNINSVSVTDIDINNENINIAEDINKKQEDKEKETEKKEKARKKQEKKAKREELIRIRSEKRIKELRDNRNNEKEREKLKNVLRDKIHPQIISKAHPVKHNPILLIKLFYPKTRIKTNANTKDILKAFKRALANFHPDKTVNKCINEQIMAEETFKLLSDAMDKFNTKTQNQYKATKPYNNYNKPNKRKKKYGWF